MITFLILMLASAIPVGILLARATRPERRQGRAARRSAKRVRPGTPLPTGGRSSRPRYIRRRRCATYEIPSFDPQRDAYIGISTNPKSRIADHMIKWWWMYVPEGVGVFRGRIKGIRITWYPSEDDAYKVEQQMIGRRSPYFNVEGNFGQGIPGPTHPRAVALHRRFIREIQRGARV